jgi:hypothetical protein
MGPVSTGSPYMGKSDGHQRHFGIEYPYLGLPQHFRLECYPSLHTSPTEVAEVSTNKNTKQLGARVVTEENYKVTLAFGDHVRLMY